MNFLVSLCKVLIVELVKVLGDKVLKPLFESMKKASEVAKHEAAAKKAAKAMKDDKDSINDTFDQLP